jgi:hypothetical protein
MMRKFVSINDRLDWKIAVLTSVSTLAIMVESYNSLTQWETLDRFLLFFVLPMAIILFIFREKPRDFGFQLGDWRAGLVLTLGSILIMAPILYYLGRSNSSMKEYYNWQLQFLPWDMLVQLFAWEFF